MQRGTLVISDLHLGRGGDRLPTAPRLRPLWQGLDEVVVNGDTAETSDPRFRAAAQEQVSDLVALTLRDGVKLTLLAGNHDPTVAARRSLSLGGGSILVTHGDALHPAIAPWSPARARMRRAWETAARELPDGAPRQLREVLQLTHRACLAEWADEQAVAEHALGAREAFARDPWIGFRVMGFWMRFPSLAAAFLERYQPAAAVGIFGHTHHAGVWHVGDRFVVNTGCFGFPSRPLAAIHRNGLLEVHTIKWRRDRYHLGRRPRHVISLPTRHHRLPGILDLLRRSA